MGWDSLVHALCSWLCRVFKSRHRVIPTSTDPNRPLLQQLAVMRMGRFGAIYLQQFLNPETYRFFHRHQWRRMRSFILSGWYEEERSPLEYNDATGKLTQVWPPRPRYIIHKRFSTYTMGREVIHRTEHWSRNCWTLFWMSPPKLEDWGYYDRENNWAFTHWRAQIKAQIPSLDKPGALT